jgi:hypothetical protein
MGYQALYLQQQQQQQQQDQHSHLEHTDPENCLIVTYAFFHMCKHTTALQTAYPDTFEKLLYDTATAAATFCTSH